ncbi:response regulator [bacterium]|nr:response regulator [bacterium]
MAKRILVIEDEPDVLKMTVFRLKKTGHEILVAVDGAEGLEMAEKEKPDLIFLDLNLPVLDGGEVCRRIKANESLKKIHVIILSASSDGMKQKAKEIGADDYIIKPYEVSDLIEKVEKNLGKAE